MVAQVVLLLVVALAVQRLLYNLLGRLDDLGISTDFDFLNQQTGFRVADSDFDPRSPAWELYLVGVKNTLLVAMVGIAIAATVGLLVGIGRLSANWLLRRLSTVFVESLRNIPPFVVIIFFAFGLFRGLPPIRQAESLLVPGLAEPGLVYSNSKWAIPSLVNGEAAPAFWWTMAATLAAAAGLWVWRTRVEERTGRPAHRLVTTTVLVTGVALVLLVALDPLDTSWPGLDGNVIRGGFSFTTAYAAVTLALGLYTATHIAEIIRGSIQAVPWGQSEASGALALSNFQRYRFVVLPQALRIAIPAVINQFLNLTKNTSLAVAVAYPELTNLTKSLIGNGKPAPQSILVAMAIYLSFSLVISLIVNLAHRRLALVTR